MPDFRPLAHPLRPALNPGLWKRAAWIGLPEIAMVALLLSATLAVRFPVLGLGRTASAFDVALLVLFPVWIVCVRRQGMPWVPRPYLLLGLLMLGLGAGSLIWSVDRGASLVHVIVSIESLLAFAYALTFLRRLRERQWMQLAQLFVVLLVLPGVLLWLGVPGFQPPAEIVPRSGDWWSYYVRLSHPFVGRSNNLAALLLLLVPPLASWAMRTKRLRDVLVALTGTTALILTFSRGALLALLIVLAVHLATEKTSRRQVWRVFRWALPVLVLAGLMAALNPVTRNLILARLSVTNIDARVDLLAGFWNDVVANWLLGMGAGTGIDVHNTYAQQLLSFGVLGGSWVSATLLWTGVWWFRQHESTRPVLKRILGLGVAAVLLSFAVESSFEGNLLRPLIWLVWGMLVSLSTRQSARVRKPRSSRSPSA